MTSIFKEIQIWWYNWTIGKHYSTTYTDLNNKNDWNNHDKGCDVSELKRILQQITALSDVPDPAVLKRLIDELRVSDKEPALANEKIQSLIDIIHQHPEYGDEMVAITLMIISSLSTSMCKPHNTPHLLSITEKSYELFP